MENLLKRLKFQIGVLEWIEKEGVKLIPENEDQINTLRELQTAMNMENQNKKVEDKPIIRES